MENDNYETVKIGNQVWMVKNMAVTVDRDGNELVLGKDYWYPNGDSSLVKEYGLLYTWEAAMRIAPKGWHLPKKEEWDIFIAYLATQKNFRSGFLFKNFTAKSLASTFGWKDCKKKFAVGNNQSINNATGFSAVPAGYHRESGHLTIGVSSYFWSGTIEGDEFDMQELAYCRYINTDGLVAGEFEIDVAYGLSVRCLRD